MSTVKKIKKDVFTMLQQASDRQNNYYKVYGKHDEYLKGYKNGLLDVMHVISIHQCAKDGYE